MYNARTTVPERGILPRVYSGKSQGSVMGIFMPGSRAKHRRFSYEPRFYDPKKDQDLRHRMRIKSLSRRKRRNPVGIILFSILLAMALFVYFQLG